MIRLGNPSKDWAYCDGSQEITFPKQEARVVKIDVRTESPGSLFYDLGDGPVFLCQILTSQETVEFVAEKDFVLYCEAPAYYRSQELFHIHSDNEDEEIFTKMHERRPVSPEMEAINRLVHKNMQRERAKLFADVAGMMRATEREYARREAARQAAEEAAGVRANDGEDDNGSVAAKDGGKAPKGAKSGKDDTGKD